MLLLIKIESWRYVFATSHSMGLRNPGYATLVYSLPQQQQPWREGGRKELLFEAINSLMTANNVVLFAVLHWLWQLHVCTREVDFLKVSFLDYMINITVHCRPKWSFAIWIITATANNIAGDWPAIIIVCILHIVTKKSVLKYYAVGLHLHICCCCCCFLRYTVVQSS